MLCVALCFGPFFFFMWRLSPTKKQNKKKDKTKSLLCGATGEKPRCALMLRSQRRRGRVEEEALSCCQR